jgi:hypothetical protein
VNHSWGWVGNLGVEHLATSPDNLHCPPPLVVAGAAHGVTNTCFDWQPTSPPPFPTCTTLLWLQAQHMVMYTLALTHQPHCTATHHIILQPSTCLPPPPAVAAGALTYLTLLSLYCHP